MAALRLCKIPSRDPTPARPSPQGRASSRYCKTQTCVRGAAVKPAPPTSRWQQLSKFQGRRSKPITPNDRGPTGFGGGALEKVTPPYFPALFALARALLFPRPAPRCALTSKFDTLSNVVLFFLLGNVRLRTLIRVVARNKTRRTEPYS